MRRTNSWLRGLPWTVVVVAALLSGCNDPGEWRTMQVTATAYTLAPDETKPGHIGLAAWGDQLKPGMNAIAVSRDLIKIGLTHGAKVKIEGLPGVYTVLDKMNKRWTRKIDILMRTKEQAYEWGKKKVTIHWKPPEKTP